MSDFSFEFDHYQIERDREGDPVILGRGALGITYLAVDTRLQKQVALKTLTGPQTTESGERFLREARAAAQINHPRIASVHYYGSCDGQCFYTMPLLDGPTLQKRISKSGVMNEGDVLLLGAQLADALSAVEEISLVHRDIKPENIILLDQGPVLIDFGLARSYDDHAGHSQLGSVTSRDIQFLGTPEFCSPEQAGHQPLDIRSDIYSLGATLWFALFGGPPILCPDGSPIPVVTEEPDWKKLRETVSPGFFELLSVMLAKDRDQRPTNCLDLIKLFNRALPLQSPRSSSQSGRETAAISGTAQPAPLSVQVAENNAKGDPRDAASGFSMLKSDSQPVLLQPSVNSINMRLAGIREGVFEMGESKALGSETTDSEDLHRVELTDSFWMGAYPVTWAEYSGLTGCVIPDGADFCPVVCLAWEDAVEFCQQLQDRETRNRSLPLGYQYTLPTEAQWEFACRAGTSSPFSFGDRLDKAEANFDSTGLTSVGTFPPNPWGLFDMHGNVWEYCKDAYRENLGRQSRTNPLVTEPSTTVVCKGGSWRSRSGSECRSGRRQPEASTSGSWDIGFRVALVKIVTGDLARAK